MSPESAEQGAGGRKMCPVRDGVARSPCEQWEGYGEALGNL